MDAVLRGTPLSRWASGRHLPGVAVASWEHAGSVRAEGLHILKIQGGVQPRPGPALGVLFALASALALSFLLAKSMWAASTMREVITLAVVVPAVACVALVIAMLGMRNLTEGSPRQAWAERAKSISVTTLIVYFFLVLPLAVLSIAGEVFQGG